MGSSLIEEIISTCDTHFHELTVIWDYIGYESEDKRKRINEISKTFKDMLDAVIAKENQLRLEIESDIENRKREITQLCQQLKIPTYFPPRDLTSYNLLKVLKEKTQELRDARALKQESFLNIYKKIIHYRKLMSLKDDSQQCQQMLENIRDHDNENISVKEDFVPTDTDIETFRKYVNSLEKDYEELTEKYHSLLKDVGRISIDIEYLGESDFERGILKEFEDLSKDSDQIISSETLTITKELLENMQDLRLKMVKRKAMLVSTCEELRTYLLSMWYRLNIDEETQKAFMQQCSGYKPDVLESLQEEVSKCQQLKWENISVYYAGLIDEKEEIERKLLINTPIRDTDFSIESLSEESVSSLEQEVDRLKEKYEKYQTLYDAVANYQNVWMAYLDVETQMKDPAILSNRGGILLKTEKEKKRLLKELPKIESVVAEAIAQYEKNNKTKFFVFNNLTFKDYVEHLWSEFRNRKDSAKYRRPGPGSQSVSNSPKRVTSPRVK